MDLQEKSDVAVRSKFGLLLVLIFIAFLAAPLFIANDDLLRARYIYTIVFNIGVAFFIWIERDHLADFHVDRWSLWVIALSGSIFHRRLGVSGEIGFQIILWIASIGIIIGLILFRSKIPVTSRSWALKGLLFALLTLVSITLIESYLSPWSYLNSKSISLNYSLPIEIIRNFFYELSYIAPLEETLFRGVLWGYLLRIGWKEEKIFWTQAILFWIIHLTRLPYPATFFITIPVGTIMLSFLVRYSKQLFPSILAHSVMNTLDSIVIYLLRDL